MPVEIARGLRLCPASGKCANCTKLMTINFAPADLGKEGTAYDLPIAVGLVIASEQVQFDLNRTLIIGELSLDDLVRHTNGVLPVAAMAWQLGFKTLVMPASDAPKAALVPGGA